jgi:hypothetical protein
LPSCKELETRHTECGASLPPEVRLRDVGQEWFLVLLDSWRIDEVALLAMIMWRAWSVRNKVTRAGETLSIEDSVQFLQWPMAQYQEAHDTRTSGRPEQSGGNCNEVTTQWSPTARNAIEINVDGAYKLG